MLFRKAGNKRVGKGERKGKKAISWTAETLQNFVPPLSVSETQLISNFLLVIVPVKHNLGIFREKYPQL